VPFFGEYEMKRLVLGAAFTTFSAVLAFSPVYAQQQQDCEKSWNSYDLNRDGYLKGEEAKKFRDDMAIQGVTVGETKNGTVSASQYSKACEANFWENLEEESGR
jgi:hypothetical protein